MPKKLHEMVDAMMAEGMDESKAYAIATSKLQKKWIMKKWKKKTKSISEKRKTKDLLHYV